MAQEARPVFADVNGIPVHYAQHGGGTPVLALHGSGVDHREIMAALEPLFADRPGYRRLYPDLPGMGHTPAPETIDSNDAVVELLLGLVDAVIGQEAFLLVGHSYGGYLARAIANRRPRQVAGLALLCSVDGQAGEDERPAHVVLHAEDDLDLDGALEPTLAAEFRNYLVVQTPETLRRFQETVAPAIALVDQAALERVFARWQLRTAPEQAPPYENPTLLLAGRQDATAGYAWSWRLLEHYPRATVAVLDRAGHALPHEQVGPVTALLGEWLDRVAEQAEPTTS
jgi:pimeloyl-ACP methyl ester carboxylesterase